MRRGLAASETSPVDRRADRRPRTGGPRELVFTPEALEATAKLALDRKTGARALRTIVEEALLDVMYDIPERTDVRKVVITAETIEHGQPPMLLTENEESEPRRRGRGSRARTETRDAEEREEESA